LSFCTTGFWEFLLRESFCQAHDRGHNAKGAGHWFAELYLGNRQYKRLPIDPADDYSDPDGVLRPRAKTEKRTVSQLSGVTLASR
jgi:hypothetical protein